MSGLLIEVTPLLRDDEPSLKPARHSSSSVMTSSDR